MKMLWKQRKNCDVKTHDSEDKGIGEIIVSSNEEKEEKEEDKEEEEESSSDKGEEEEREQPETGTCMSGLIGLTFEDTQKRTK